MSYDRLDSEVAPTLVSADSHVNEPPELWNVLSAYGSRAPHVAKNGGTSGLRGDWFLAEEIRPFPLSMNNVGAYRREERRPLLAGEFDFTRDASRAAYEPEARFEAMKVDGVRAEVLYPTYAMRFPCLRDPELQYASLKVSNEWLVQFCRSSPSRFAGVANIALSNVGRAIDDLHWSLQNGLKGVAILATPPADLPYSSSHYERFWAAAAEAEVPVSLHALPPLETYALSNRRRAAVVENRTMALIEDFHLANVLYDHQIQACLAHLVLSGVLERHPKLKLVLSEWGTGWITNFLGSLDYTYQFKPEGLPLKLRPSEYLLRQVWWTFDRPLGMTTEEIQRLEDRLMWASDFPHIESSFPGSRKMFEESVAGLPAATAKKLGFENCARLYSIEIT